MATEKNTGKTKKAYMAKNFMGVLAFDEEGKRLGRGKGCYDRFLKKLPAKVCKIGLAFKFQLCDCLPFDSLRDVKVDLVVSA